LSLTPLIYLYTVVEWLDIHAVEIQSVLQGHTVSQKFLSAASQEGLPLSTSPLLEKTPSSVYTEQLKLCIQTLCSQFASVWRESVKSLKKTPVSTVFPPNSKTLEPSASPLSVFPPNSSVDSPSILRGEIPSLGTLWGITVGKGANNILLKAEMCSLIMEGDASQYKENIQKSFSQWTLLHSSELEKFENTLDEELLKEMESHPLLYRCDKWIPSLISGFELACLAGPLAEEPVRGVAFLVESIRLKEHFSSSHSSSPYLMVGGDSDIHSNSSAPSSNPTPSFSEREEATAASSRSLPYGPFTGQIMSTMKECCRKALLQRGFTRIQEAMLRIELQCEQEVLGRAFNVLAKRRAQILAEDLKEGSSMFAVDAIIPASESFGLAQDLRSKASGKVSLHLQFSHWELLDEDPFPEASMTEMEMEEEGGHPMNTARKIINDIRKRKGLITEEKVIIAAEKQRTLGRNK
ncbi:elongation factor Tu GTP binding domain-containing protein, partial [Cardiosporidium cionae]